MIAPFFNLLINSTFSLLTGLVIVGFFLWLFRVQTGRWKLFLLSLPFLKIVFDFMIGIPSNSILLMGVDPFRLPPNSQFISISAGANWWGPRFNAAFYVLDQRGREFAASVGDYASIWILQHLGIFSILLFLGCVMISLFLLFRRMVRVWRFERHRRQDRATARTLANPVTADAKIDLYVSKTYHGSPFTGGLWHPYICVPLEAAQALAPEELRAVVAHEMGHVRSYDIWGTLFIRTVGDVFWFVPGYHWLSRRLDGLREILADQAAVAAGADPLHLASALLKLKEFSMQETRRLPLHSAFFREKSLLKIRMNRLLNQTAEPQARFGWQNQKLRWLVAVWIAAAVFLSTLGGNRVDQFSLEKKMISGFQSLFQPGS